jgi:hypothetical protein
MSEEYPSPFNGGVKVPIKSSVPIWLRHPKEEEAVEESENEEEEVKKM